MNVKKILNMIKVKYENILNMNVYFYFVCGKRSVDIIHLHVNFIFLHLLFKKIFLMKIKILSALSFVTLLSIIIY